MVPRLPRTRSASVLWCLVLLAATPFWAATRALAHDDDPKALSAQPPYRGPGYRSVWAARPEGRTLPVSAARAAARRRSPGTPVIVGTPVAPTHSPADPPALASIASPQLFASSGVELLSWVTLPEFGPDVTCGNDCWGYVSPSGREYALMGLSHGTGFVEVTTPSDPQVIAMIPGPISLWRDIKVYQDHVYAVSEGGGGIQIFDVSLIDSGIVTYVGDQLVGGDTENSHNVVIDTVSGFLYRCGGGDNGLRIYDLADPADPTFVGSWSDRYVHDAQVVTYTSGPFANRQIAFCCSGLNGGIDQTGLDVLDVTDPTDIFTVDQFFYPNPAYSHQAWLSPDRTLLYLNDELDEGPLLTTTHVINVADIEDVFLANTFDNGNAAIGHNLYTVGDRMYEANYRSGLRIFDIGTNPTDPAEIAWFDTYPLDDAAEFNGIWSSYPFFPSGTVIGSDRERGLFVWWVGAPLLDITYPGGLPSVGDPAGDNFVVRITEASPGDLAPGTAQLHYDLGQGLQSVALTPLGGADYQATLPGAACGDDVDFYVSAESTNGIVWKDPPGMDGSAYSLSVSLGEGLVSSDDVESPTGWVSGAIGDDAVTGLWVHGDPIGTDSQPEDDHTPSGSACWFTGQGSVGGETGENDVDGGATTLLSPSYDLTGVSEPRISFWYWYMHRFGSGQPDDSFSVDVSSDGGSNWFNVLSVEPGDPSVERTWVRHEFRVADFVPPTNQVRVRFVASDLSNGSIVEAAVDDIEVSSRQCPDCDGDGISDAMAIATGLALDSDGDGQPDTCQPLSADTLSVSAGSGGSQVLTIDAGPANAGRTYFLIGSVTGTSPGFNIGTASVPLNFDPYTDFTIAFANTFIANSLGTLDGSGQASASFNMPAGFGEFAGLLFHHAYVLTSPFDFASNPVSLELVP